MIYYIFLMAEMALFCWGLLRAEFFLNLGYIGFISSALGIIAFNIISIINLGNIFQYCYSKRKNLASFPLYLCPFLITKNQVATSNYANRVHTDSFISMVRIFD
jgi:hypothetical protein